jgi:glutamate-ammonia-ligase adenylyltransferase
MELADYQAELTDLFDSLPAANDVPLMQGLRLFRLKHMLRIAWRDLAGLAATTETLANLTDLAEACVDSSLEFLYQDQCRQLGVPQDEAGRQQRLVVLGMGKLGGHELNFSSDIDLIFAFPEEGDIVGARSMANSQFFIRLGQRFIRVLNDVTADGFVFRVDMRLRPYGDSGPLVMSFDGMEQYYQTQGRDWERYAMIKARVIGGDRQAGEELMAMLRPFVYRRYLDFGAFESIREMKAMIEKEIRRKGNRNNIKLGRGGIREIEFIGQTYQLIRGGGESELQVRSIIAVLRLLAEKGYMNPQETRQLIDSYDFLRRLENRLQMYADAQTHTLPEQPQLQQSMALAMDYASWDELYAASQQQLKAVHACFSNVFALSDEGAQQTAVAQNPLVRIWQDQLDEEEACELLHRHGISQCDEVVHQLTAFRDSVLISSLAGSSRQRLDNLMPLLLKQLSGMEAPGEVVLRLLNLLQAIVRRSVYLALLIEYPVALQQLIRLCAASPWIAHLLTRYPILLDELLDARALYDIPNRKQLARELDSMLAQAVDDEERELDVLRQFKQAHVLRVAAMDVAGALKVFDVSEHLTMLAEVLLDRVYQLAWHHLVKRHGKPLCNIDDRPCEPGMAIVAYGKMGGEELGYGSDLDIVFLHDSRGQDQYTDGQRSIDNSTFFARLAQRIVHLLSTQTSTGRLYEVDTRLRPDGAAGMLVSSIEAFDLYQQDKAWTWEHQALLRARMVIGSVHLVEEFARIRRSVLTQPRDLAALRQDVISMRQKMRDNLGSKKPGQFHLKQDEGGLVDIEFMVQFGVLAHAAKHPELLEFTATRQFIRALQQCGCLDSEQVTELIAAYELYRARGHQRALQEQPATLEDDEFPRQREQVKRIWQQVVGD